MGKNVGLLDSIVYYIFYLAAVAVVAMGVGYYNQTRTKVLDDFFKYVRRGRKRVPRLRNHAFAFFALQFPYILLITTVPLPVYFVVTVVIFYLYALSTDRVKKHRHNGIRIGYEYPHPKEVTRRPGSPEEIQSRLPVYYGSKGIYDLQIKSEPNPHAMIVGESGSGKTSLAVGFLARAYTEMRIPFLIVDWSGSYKAELDVNIWKVPSNLRINPFILRGMVPERRSGIAAETLQFSLSLTDMQTQRVRQALDELYQEGKAPNIQMLYGKIAEAIPLEQHRDIKLQLRYITEKLSQAFGVFGEEPAGFWDSYDRTCSIVDLEGLTDAEKKLVTYAIIQRITEEFRSTGSTRLYIALDDAYQALLDYYGKETNITRIIREGRKYGFGVVVATQMLGDLPAAIVANTSMKFVLSYHEPYQIERVYAMLNMGGMEREILHRMPKGHCFLFDQNAIQGGRSSLAFLEIDRLGREEKERLASSIKRVEIAGIPVDAPMTQQKTLGHEKEVEGTGQMPGVSVYRFLIALDRKGDVTEAVKFLKEKRLITSKSTLYGGTKQPSMIDRAKDSGYLDKDGKLTEKALDVIRPERLVDKQGPRKGGEDHVAMMKQIILMEQEHGNFVVVPREEGFDVGVVMQDRSMKGVWSRKRLRAYEVQTTAIRSEIERCVERSRQGGYELIFATNSDKVRKEILDMTNERYKVILVKPYPELAKDG